MHKELKNSALLATAALACAFSNPSQAFPQNAILG